MLPRIEYFLWQHGCKIRTFTVGKHDLFNKITTTETNV